MPAGRWRAALLAVALAAPTASAAAALKKAPALKATTQKAAPATPPAAAPKPAPLAPGSSYSDASCAQCHAGLTAKKFKHSSLKDGSCADCHLPADRPTRCEGALGKGWALKKRDPELCADCHDTTGDTPIHKIVELRGCSACHDPHGSDVKKNLLLPKERLCLRCHTRPSQGRFVHTAVRRGDCVGCHQPHSGVEKPLLKEAKDELCAECHAAKDLSQKPHRDPARACLDCHAPHSSDTAGLLRDKVPPRRPRADEDLASATYPEKPCLTCHAEVTAKKFRHSFFKDGTCGDCHLPADTETGRCQQPVGKGWRLKRPEPELCVACHDKSGETPMHKAVGLGGCTACHDAHSADAKGVLKAKGEALCARCHRPKGDDRVVHTAVKEGSCVGCHEPHAGVEKPLLREARKELCDECHPKAEVAKGPAVHTPVAEGRCLDCHRAHASPNDHLLELPAGPKLCLSCHDAKQPAPTVLGTRRLDLGKAVVHQPIAKEGCQGCHATGHSGPHPKLLKQNPATLCYDCHERKDTHRFNHGAVRQGDCTVCHAEHSADQKNLLRQAKPAQLCFTCHEDDLSGRRFVHRPAGEGKCDLCHDPHGADAKANLKVAAGAKLCLDCHAYREAPTVRHAAHDRYGCVGCHDPHGTGNPAQLVKPVNELCVSCHPKQPDGFHATSIAKDGHPVSGWDGRRARDFSCASCHDPHGSKFPKLYYFGTEALDMCQGCHGDRTGKRPHLVDVTGRRRPELDGGVAPTLPPSITTRPGAGEYPKPAPPDAGAPAKPVAAKGARGGSSSRTLEAR